MVKTVTATEFRVNMNDLMTEVFNGTTVVVKKHKKVMFMCVPPGSELCTCNSEDNKDPCDVCSEKCEPSEDLVETANEVPTPPSRPGKVVD